MYNRSRHVGVAEFKKLSDAANRADYETLLAQMYEDMKSDPNVMRRRQIDLKTPKYQRDSGFIAFLNKKDFTAKEYDCGCDPRDSCASCDTVATVGWKD